MERQLVTKLILSGVVAAIFIAVYSFLKFYARKTMLRNSLAQSRYILVKKILSAILALVGALLIVHIWGIEIRNIWVSIAGLAAMIAIAFFAIWSLIGNILAGLLLYFSSPFKLNDMIEIQPDNIRGRVIAINTFFTLLRDSGGDYINIPNSLFFQKYIKVADRGKPRPSQ